MVGVIVTPPPQIVGLLESNTEATSSWVFPNPNQGVFFINMDQKMSLTTIQVFDIMGRTIAPKSIDIVGDNYRIDLGDVPNGIYLFQLNTSGKTLRSRLIISK